MRTNLHIFYKILAGVLMFLLLNGTSFAQCAMCRATVENNVSNGEVTIGAGLNTGIIYLMLLPYLILAVIAYFWYKNSRKYTEQKAKVLSTLASKGL